MNTFLPPLTEKDKRKLKLTKEYFRFFAYISLVQLAIYEIYILSFQSIFSFLKILFLLPLFVAYFYSKNYFKVLEEQARKFRIEKRLRVMGILGLLIFPFSYAASNPTIESSNNSLSWIIAFLTFLTMIIFEKLYIKLTK